MKAIINKTITKWLNNLENLKVELIMCFFLEDGKNLENLIKLPKEVSDIFDSEEIFKTEERLWFQEHEWN